MYIRKCPLETCLNISIVFQNSGSGGAGGGQLDWVGETWTLGAILGHLPLRLCTNWHLLLYIFTL